MSKLAIEISSPKHVCQKRRWNRWFHKTRHVYMILAGIAVGLMYFCRMGLSLIIVDMVHPSEAPDDVTYPDRFRWSNEIQQIICGGYMATYAVMQVPMTRLANYYGARASVGLSLVAIGLSCVLIPQVAHFGWQYVALLRLIHGLAASPMISGLLDTIADWYPHSETVFGLSLMQFLQMTLTVVTPLVSGELSSYHWYWAFYIPGYFTMAFGVVWWVFARERAEDSPFVSEKELAYIRNSGSDNPEEHGKKNNLPYADAPWYFVLTIPDFYPIAFCWLTHVIAFSGFFFLLPNYFQKVMNIPIEENGVYNFIVSIGLMISMVWINPVVNFITSRFGKSLTFSRKLCVATYPLIPIFTWLYIAIYHDLQIPMLFANRLFVETSDFLIVASMISRFGPLGLNSLVYSMQNSVASAACFAFSWLCGRYLDQEDGSEDAWSNIMILESIVYVLFIIVYILFVSSEPLQLTKKGSTRSTTEAS